MSAEALDEIPFELSRPAKTPRKRAHAQRLGRAGEAWCHQQHELALQLGLAKIDKVYPPTVGAPGRMFFGEKSTVDYVGTLLSTGMYLCAECKSFGGNRFAMKELKPHQRAHLDAIERARKKLVEEKGPEVPAPVALLILVRLATAPDGTAIDRVRDVYVLPWWKARTFLSPSKTRGEFGAIPLEEIRDQRVPAGALYLEPWVTR